MAHKIPLLVVVFYLVALFAVTWWARRLNTRGGGGAVGYLLAGRGFSVALLGSEGPTSQQAPFYPLLLGAVYACLGSGTSASILAMQLLQCVAGSGLVLGDQ